MTPSITSDGGQTWCREEQHSRKTHTAMNQLAEIPERATFVVRRSWSRSLHCCDGESKGGGDGGSCVIRSRSGGSCREIRRWRGMTAGHEIWLGKELVCQENIEAFESGSTVLESFPFSSDLLWLLRRPVNWKNTRRSNSVFFYLIFFVLKCFTIIPCRCMYNKFCEHKTSKSYKQNEVVKLFYPIKGKSNMISL